MNIVKTLNDLNMMNLCFNKFGSCANFLQSSLSMTYVIRMICVNDTDNVHLRAADLHRVTRTFAAHTPTIAADF